MIEIDGNIAEGGGQIVRTALGLSCVTLKPVRIKNIRKTRKEPGLKAQHVACAKACAQMSNAFISGAELGSTEIEFVPRVSKNRQLNISIGTAGSITLLLQGLLPPLLFTESEIHITGGTDVQWSMPIDYMQHVLIPMLSPYCKIEVICDRRGYYPKGDGKVIIKTKPRFKRPDFDSFEDFQQYIFGNPALALHRQGELIRINGVSHASAQLQAQEVSERQAQAAELMLRNEGPVSIHRSYAQTESIGSGITIYALFQIQNAHGETQYRMGADVLGERGVKSEEIARRAAEKLRKNIHSGFVVEEILQDNIIPYLGLFGGSILTGTITEHTRANIAVCEAFLGVEYSITAHNDASLISVLNSSKP